MFYGNILALCKINIWKSIGPRISKAILKKKNKNGELKLPETKTYYKVL